MPLNDSFQKRTRSNLVKMSAVPSLEDLAYSLESARNLERQPVFLAWVVRSEIRVLSVVCGAEPGTDDPYWLLRSGEKVDSPILWKHLTSDVHLIHEIIKQELTSEFPAAVIPDFLRPGAAPPPDGVDSSSLTSFDNQSIINAFESDAPGTVFADKYEIVEEIGRGAMGIVYKAKQRVMNRFVALKILHQHLVEKDINKKRFEYEVRAASALSHANLIIIHDFGTSPMGRPYIVMDYVEGPSLQDVLTHGGALDVASLCEIFTQICRGLSHAHRRGIIHRDLKPSNIKLADGDKGSVLVKVIDFGIAKITQNKDEDQQLTKLGDIVGSPLFMSPEQCKGESLDARTDIYSIGCMMYQCITGTLPFLGKDPFETMYKHIYETPPLLETVRPDLKFPEEVGRIIFKALEIDVDKRYSSVDDLETDLRNLRNSGIEVESNAESTLQVTQSSSTIRGLTVDLSSLLKKAGIVNQHEIDDALKLAKEVGGDITKIFVAAGKITPKTVEAAIKCKQLIDKGQVNVSQAVILLGYCSRKDLTYEEGSRDLGWETAT